MVMTYAEIGQKLQIERDWCHNAFSGQLVTRQEGIDTFNEMAQAQGLSPLRDPIGYMCLDNNVYQAIKDTYTEKYDNKAYEVEQGLSMGTTYALDYVLDNLDRFVRKDSKLFLPEDVSYGELRFISNTPEIQDAVDKMVDKRILMTLKASIRRSVTDDDFIRTFSQFKESATQVGNRIEQSMTDTLLSDKDLALDDKNYLER